MTDDLDNKAEQLLALVGRKILTAFFKTYGRDPDSPEELADWMVTPNGKAAVDHELAREKDTH
jgi:hypothetical protein